MTEFLGGNSAILGKQADGAGKKGWWRAKKADRANPIGLSL